MDLSKLSFKEKLELAKNTNTSQETLIILANDGLYAVRYFVAKNPNTPSETLTVLASDKDWYVRYRVARNPNTPQYIKDYFIAKNFISLSFRLI
jgi:hypothetical protein